MDASKDNLLIASLGEVKLDDTGRGETWWEYKEEDIANTGSTIEKFGVAAVIVDGEKLQAPLAGYAGKEKQLWKEKLLETSRHKEKECHEDKKPNSAHEKELEEEAKKFKEYEEMLKKDMEEIKKKEEEKEEKEKKKCMEEHEEDKKDSLDIKDMENNCQLSSNMDTYLKDNKDKPHENADAFHRILKNYEEDEDLEEQFNNSRWWMVPFNQYEDYKGDGSYEHYCAVHHLKMAYPYMDYIKYIKKCGHSYFGIKYDKDGEVKYLMYGIEGDNMPQDQPYMGMTGFVKWVKPHHKDKGMWIMYYNPYNGCIMIPKAKEDRGL